MLALRHGRYTARLAATPDDLRAAQSLRYQCFVAGHDHLTSANGRDADRFDAACHHMLVEDAATGALASTYRLLPLRDGRELHLSYAAQFYDLERLSVISGPMMELGRFCTAPDRVADPDVLRVAWGAMARLVDDNRVLMLFGCTSFPGADPSRHLAALQALARRYLGPAHLRPGVRAAEVVNFAASADGYDPQLAAAQTPRLLRTYLTMGGWVSDHAVLDRDLDTLHVFTALDIAAIPPARARALRAVAR